MLTPFRWIVLSLCGLVAAGCGDRVAELERRLSSVDVDARRSAARELGELGDEARGSIPALNAALRDDDREVRRLAGHALGELGEHARASVPFLVGALGDREQSVRLAAAFALASIDPRSEAYVPVLSDAMRAGDGGVIVSVGRMGERAGWAVPILVSILSNDARPGIRRLAADALHQIGATGSEDARVALEKAAAEDQDDRVREAAAGIQ